MVFQQQSLDRNRYQEVHCLVIEILDNKTYLSILAGTCTTSLLIEMGMMYSGTITSNTDMNKMGADTKCNNDI